MNYAIIGCGLIGKKRLAGLPAGSKLAIACDTNLSRAEDLVKIAQTGRALADFNQAIADPQVEAVVVATINSALAEVTAAAIRAGKPVIVEKPAGISVKQIDELIALEKKHNVCVRVGFNHRYHPAFADLCDRAGCHAFSAGHVLYVDEHHLSPAGAAIVGQRLDAALRNWPR